MEKNIVKEKKPLEMPKADAVKLNVVHNAKSWNPGKGNDTTGTGNSDHGGSQGNGPKKQK